MRVLAIETSCDETSAAVVEYKLKKPGAVNKNNCTGKFKVRSNIVSSQIKIHQKTGGVVPEVAAREHVKNIIPVIDEALKEGKTKWEKIDRIAVATGPGLITSLMVGTETGKVLSLLWDKPFYEVNHLEGHLGANFLLNKKIIYPAICLVVSGGHTELVLMKKAGSYKLVGATRDDAAGECFDKCAKILGLKYPGGPEISKKAEGKEATIDFPSPMINSGNLEFSFAGLKTAVLYYTQKNKYKLGEACASVQRAIVKVLVKKTLMATEKYKVKTVMLAGGVSANKELRQEFEKTFSDYNLLIPDFDYCTDQAAMIGAAGALKKKSSNIKKIKVDPNWEL